MNRMQNTMDIEAMKQRAQEAAKFIQSIAKGFKTDTSIMLGTGFSAPFLESALIKHKIHYNSIQGFKSTNVKSHPGEILFVTIAGKLLVALAGRCHLYEGYSIQEVVFPIYVLYALGVRNFICTSAVGGVRSDQKPGELVLITDHVNWSGRDPFFGTKIFGDITSLYKNELSDSVRESASIRGIRLANGIMWWITGPTFESFAEAKLVETLGGSTIAFSTMCEAMHAHYLGMAVCAVQCITDVTHPKVHKPKELNEIIAYGEQGGRQFMEILKELVKRL